MKLFGIRWRFYGAAQPEHGWKTALSLFAVFALATFAGVMWSRSGSAGRRRRSRRS